VKKALIVAVALLIAAGTWWFAAKSGLLGHERDAGPITGKAVPASVIAARGQAIAAATPEGRTDQILFGDLHVHTTYSTDAFMWALPILGGPGVHPVGDACDFARYCSGLDFWAITDHAEAGTPYRWEETKRAMRQCQAVSGNGESPDLVSFVGFEWTQVGATPAEHYGHKNVIFESLDDGGIAAREIASGGQATLVLRKYARGISPIFAAEDLPDRDIYYDFNRFIRDIQKVPDCDPKLSSDRLPADCFEIAATPGELVRKLDEQGLEPLIIPHGSSWGFYTPAGTTWDKSLAPAEDPGRFRLIEIYSGHGNSEEYRSWQPIVPNADGTSATCPPPTRNYLPSCWRAGDIIMERCLETGQAEAVCTTRADEARLAYANMGVAGHLVVGGERSEDWLDAGQCTDCFLPPFNHRPGTSVQYGLAVSRFDDDSNRPTRFQWGFIGSSDNHRARPGTGYKPVDRRENTEATGAVDEKTRLRLLGDQGKPDAYPHPVAQEQLRRMVGFQLTEFERQSSFFLTGGLAAVHAAERSREAIWDALQRREVYATSGHKILLWFDAIDATSGAPVQMGGELTVADSPTFTVRAVGSFKQQPGCPDFAKAGMDQQRLATLCSGECDNPSDVRNLITRIEVVRIRPQAKPGEPVDGLIEDKFLVHECPPDPNGCSYTFTDPGYAGSGRDAIYYVRAIEEPQPTINADPLQCERDAQGRCIKVRLCFGDYRSGTSDCTAPSEPRAWSSPIYLYHPAAGTRG
jgi:Protein of unknown function (DUF3604)